ncbi:MAG TPA: hypothetical protein VH478_17860 [Trebonia sp.]|jgi:hypothetical protein|nr:hypothetical protein [Trebonia sp.]
MQNPPPEKPQVNDIWVDDDNVLRVWDGGQWVPYEDSLYFPTGTTYRED